MGGIFVIVALFLYVTVIAFAIASKKWKRFSSERILKYHELHRRKGHIIFIIITIFVFFLVVYASLPLALIPDQTLIFTFSLLQGGSDIWTCGEQTVT